MQKRTLGIALGVAGLLLIWVVAIFMGSDESDAPAQPSAAVPAPLDPGPAEAAGMRAPPSSEAAAPRAAQPADAPKPATTREPAAHAQLRPERMGPVDRLKAAYAADARDAQAGAIEQRIRDQFKQPEVPEGMLRGVSCVKSACKLELRWTIHDRDGYMIAMMSLLNHVSQELAAEPVGQDDGQQVHAVDVYVSRIVPAAEPPAE